MNKIKTIYAYFDINGKFKSKKAIKIEEDSLRPSVGIKIPLFTIIESIVEPDLNFSPTPIMFFQWRGKSYTRKYKRSVKQIFIFEFSKIL